MVESKFEVLGHLAEMVTEKISSSELTLETYISTENMVPNRGGIQHASKLPTTAKVNAFLPGDVLFSNIRTYFKKVWLANRHGGASADVIIFRPLDKQKIDCHYLYYVLSSDAFIASTVTASKGTKMPRGDKNAMGHYKVRLPTLLIQQKVSTILSAYDDLIENNLRRIKILEEMAQYLYREWFVKFRFPNHEQVHMANSTLGKIPNNWRVTSLGHLSVLRKDKYKEAMHAGMPLLDLAKMLQRSLLVGAMGNSNELSSSRILFEEDDVLFGSIRPYLHKVALAPCSGVTNVSVLVIRPTEARFRAILAVLLSSIDAVRWADQHSTGTKMPVIKWESFSEMPVILPDRYTLTRFQEIVWPMLQSIKTASRRIKNLRETRDLLIPKLISGELDVSELDIDIREAV